MVGPAPLVRQDCGWDGSLSTQRHALRRALVALIVISTVASACETTNPTPSSGPVAVSPAPGSPGPDASPGPSTASGPSPRPDDAPEGFMPLPADIVAGVDAIVGATSDEARVAATVAALERIGVVVDGGEAASTTSPVGIVLAPEEVEQLAIEAADRSASRATFLEFATTFGGMALLPPNDALAVGLPDDWLDVPPEPGGGQVRLDLSDVAPRMVAVINTWVTSAIEHHGAADPDLVQLTNAPLLMAELVRRGPQPVDVSKPFAPGDVHLGWLEITLLVGGLRGMLAASDAAEIAAAPAGQMLAGARGSAVLANLGIADPTPCDNLKGMLDSRVPLASTVIKGFVGDQIKGFIQNFVNAMFGEASAFAQNVGRAFKILGVIFRVQALIMFYSESRAKVEMEPAEYHKPDGAVARVSAVVRAGIDDAAWEAAKQARQLSPFATAVRVCARFLGLPVWQDLVDIGDAVESWKVQWSLRQGGAHVQLPARDQFTSGRLERPLTKESDHSGVDAIDYEVLPEKREYHPGTEQTAPVTFCAEVFAKEPPGGFGTILSAGGAGASLAGGAYLGLIAVVAKLLTSWISTVSGKEACGEATVSYHIPMPGEWTGKITVNTEVHESSQATQTQQNGPGQGVTVSNTSSSRSIDVTDELYVFGTDAAAGDPYVPLEARQFTHGAGSETRSNVRTNEYNSGCNYDISSVTSSGGGWSFDSDARVTVSLGSDGRYTISWSGDGQSRDFNLPGERVIAASVHTPNCEDNESGSYDASMYAFPSEATVSGVTASGQLDPKNPGNRLSGSTSVVGSNGWITTVTWSLIHEGPIILPEPEFGG